MKQLFLNSRLFFSRALTVLLAFACLNGCATIEKEEIGHQYDPYGVPFLGMQVAEAGVGPGVRINRLQSGPMLMALQRNLSINVESDRLISIDGAAVTVENFNEHISRFSPGQTVTLTFASIEGEETNLKELTVTVGDQASWTGPIDKSGQAMLSKRHQDIPLTGVDSALATLIKEALRTHEINQDIDALHELFSRWQTEYFGFHSLSRVMFPFQHPYYLTQLEKTVSQPIVRFAAQPQAIYSEIAKNLDLTVPAVTACMHSSANKHDIEIAFHVAQGHLQQAFGKFTAANMREQLTNLEYLLLQLADRQPLHVQLQPERSLAAMNSSMQIDFDALLKAAQSFSCLLNKDLIITAEGSFAKSLPAELRGSVSGNITAVIRLEQGWFIIGGNGANRYDMARIDAVYDPSGNDSYYSSGNLPGRVKLVIDHEGNDSYKTDNGGPGSAWLGVSLLVDHQGNDSYSGKLASNAAGMMGIGIVIDHGGRDSYEGQFFSNGAAFYGAGLLIDLGNEADSYRSGGFSQGLGGPRGFGLIYDQHGNDLYLANHVLPSVYGTPAVYASFSQGFGFGMRYYDSGGIGVIIDGGGNDRYDGGEFSQGGAYYWGLGILHDHDGNDVYQGNRYSQGFGVHQATGILIDDAGDDHYWAMTAACQGAAWDIAIGLLVDQAGNDAYRGDNLCQGAAAMQGQAWLIDLQGQDHYLGSGRSIQGQSGNNSYHYNPIAPVYSWSLLIDADEGVDFYSAGYSNDATHTSARFNELQPENSQAFGLFLDLPAIKDLTFD